MPARIIKIIAAVVALIILLAGCVFVAASVYYLVVP